MNLQLTSRKAMQVSVLAELQKQCELIKTLGKEDITQRKYQYNDGLYYMSHSSYSFISRLRQDFAQSISVQELRISSLRKQVKSTLVVWPVRRFRRIEEKGKPLRSLEEIERIELEIRNSIEKLNHLYRAG